MILWIDLFNTCVYFVFATIVPVEHGGQYVRRRGGDSKRSYVLYRLTFDDVHTYIHSEFPHIIKLL